MKLFLGFLLVSGVGWILDLLSYTTLTQAFDVSPAFANFASSMVGVTYVWLIALNRVFKQGGHGKYIFLPIYWTYQAVSILGYSMLISIVVVKLVDFGIDQVLPLPAAVLAKLMVTPVNLLTNFLFMTVLTKFMSTDSDGQVRS
ncbi:GtrA family protein [Pseudomonas sp. B21-041]|jgi:putative flippase GtrA|uniref:GtrA family protein n=1 Tax=Pseudomonas germanica TaxID=2815720 RepID=A0ABX8YKA2_9PSED|nr:MULTISPECIES: GtrA family protein [Pseudomonas]QYY80339.1 GtrA family protein [Pseudomonas germanica]UVL33247.1 GtrA family protein [Pseudomonas sp. B21-041]